MYGPKQPVFEDLGRRPAVSHAVPRADSFMSRTLFEAECMPNPAQSARCGVDQCQPRFVGLHIRHFASSVLSSTPRPPGPTPYLPASLYTFTYPIVEVCAKRQRQRLRSHAPHDYRQGVVMAKALCLPAIHGMMVSQPIQCTPEGYVNTDSSPAAR
jgi:hypothetical protein